jgi:hypothetical protein
VNSILTVVEVVVVVDGVFNSVVVVRIVGEVSEVLIVDKATVIPVFVVVNSILTVVEVVVVVEAIIIPVVVFVMAVLDVVEAVVATIGSKIGVVNVARSMSVIDIFSGGM